jgi:hypothetical protein
MNNVRRAFTVSEKVAVVLALIIGLAGIVQGVRVRHQESQVEWTTPETGVPTSVPSASAQYVFGPEDHPGFMDPPPDEAIDRALDAIECIETLDYDAGAVGDKHLPDKAYGTFQIRQPYLDDVNHIVGEIRMKEMWGKPRLTLVDVRRYPKVARWASREYLLHYGEKYRKDTGQEPTMEAYVRMHNGGPEGWGKAVTNKYAQKAKDAL